MPEMTRVEETEPDFVRTVTAVGTGVEALAWEQTQLELTGHRAFLHVPEVVSQNRSLVQLALEPQVPPQELADGAEVGVIVVVGVAPPAGGVVGEGEGAGVEVTDGVVPGTVVGEGVGVTEGVVPPAGATTV